MTRIIRYLVEHSLAVNLVSLFLVGIGIYAAIEIQREAFPNVNLDLVSIDFAYPGATPPEVEQLVITPIEQELKRLNGIDTMLSTAYPGSGRITLELDPDAANRERIVSDVQLAVERAELPDDLPNEPTVTEIESSIIPILRLAIAAERTPLELKRLGDKLQDDLLDIPGVARVAIQGERKAEIRVTVNPERLREQRISIGDIAAAIEGWNVNAPGGEIETPTGYKQVRVAGEFQDAGDAAAIMLRANERGRGIRLGDVATVTDTLEEARRYYDVSGEPGIAMLVLKKADADIIETVAAIDRYIASVPARYGADVVVDKFDDFARFTRLRLSVLTSNALVGAGLVFLTLILFLRPSVALTTTWGLPIIFLSGLYILYAMDVTLNLISMFGFIMVLGMLVDDAIVVGENITWHMERGMAPRQAAVQGTVEVLKPVTATVMTTVVAFLPLAFMTGLIGKFVWAIPLVVIILLVLSWLESFLMLPVHVADVTSKNKHPPERRWLVRLENGYARALAGAVRFRVLTVLLSLALLVGAVWLARGVLTFELFPPVAVDQYIVRVTAPSGTGLDPMREHMLAVDKAIRSRIAPEYLDATVVGTGEIAIDEGDPLTQRGSRFGQIRVLYAPAVTRPEHDAIDDMRRLIKELPPLFPNLDLAITPIVPGPPTGRALEAEISGDDDAAQAAAGRLMALLQDVPGVLSVDSGLKAGSGELHVTLDHGLAAYVGVDLETAAQHVRAAVGGLVVSTVRQGTEEVDVTIRYPEGKGSEIENLKELRIPNRRGGLVPLARIGSLEEHPGYSAIRHKDGLRVLRVVADVDSSIITSVELNRLVAERESEWLGPAAERLRVNYGGEQEENVASFRQLVISFGFALIAIFFILAIQFNNLGYPLIVMLAIPFGIVGVVLTFWLHNLFRPDPMPLSFLSTMGTVALSGVVVNSAIVLLSFVQEARDAGVEAHEAIIQAGRRRLRAVILTATTTVVGLLPTAYGWGGFDPLVAPMALALGWGLAFSTFITLFTIPAALALAVDVREGLRKVARRAPQPEEGR